MQSFHPDHPNTPPLEALIELLRQEEAIYAEIAGLLDEEREALLKLAVERIGEIAARKETLALRIKALDESRKVLARRLAKQFELGAEQVTLRELCRRAPRSAAYRLESVGRALRERVEVCREKNAYNARAARNGMALVNSAIDHLIAQTDPAGKVYQAGRRPQGGYATLSKTTGSGLISRRA